VRYAPQGDATKGTLRLELLLISIPVSLKATVTGPSGVRTPRRTTQTGNHGKRYHTAQPAAANANSCPTSAVSPSVARPHTPEARGKATRRARSHQLETWPRLMARAARTCSRRFDMYVTLIMPYEGSRRRSYRNGPEC